MHHFSLSNSLLSTFCLVTQLSPKLIVQLNTAEFLFIISRKLSILGRTQGNIFLSRHSWMTFLLIGGDSIWIWRAADLQQSSSVSIRLSSVEHFVSRPAFHCQVAAVEHGSYLELCVFVDVLGPLSVQDELGLVGHSHYVVLHSVAEQPSTSQRELNAAPTCHLYEEMFGFCSGRVKAKHNWLGLHHVQPAERAAW